MQRDERDLLQVLKEELEFLNRGGYAGVPGSGWRPVYIFEDSPACMNHDYEVNAGSCGDCVLLQLVPPEFRSDKHPCRHIRLSSAGETLDFLYSYGEQREIEEKVRNWLESTISRLEEHRKTRLRDGSLPAAPEAGGKGTALRENAKCANPACRVTFDWRKGGKFLRFRETREQTSATSEKGPPAGIHGVRHFWLCERCSHLFTLAYEEHIGVVLKTSWPDLLVAEDEQLPAA